MTRLQEQWEGASLSGMYTLEHWLGGDDRAAFFQTSLAPDGRRAIIRLVPEAVVDGAALFDLWERTRQLRHPNLLEILDCGRSDHDGEIAIYAVFEYHDDTLASALSRSALNRLEACEVLDSVISALRYLHAQGLVLGALNPENILAVGERIKISTATLRGADTPSDYLNDVRLLGELWQEALMSASPLSAEIAAHAADPNPQARWTLAEISAALDLQSTVSQLATPFPVSSSAGSKPLISVASVSEPPVVVSDTASASPRSHRRTSERASSHRLLTWIFVGAAGVLLLILGLNRSRLADFSIQTRGDVNFAPVETVPAPVRKTAEPKVTLPTARKPSPVAGKEMWRVIAFTYRSRDAAAKKAQQLNKDNPGLEASVFSPNEKSGYYLVSIGGRMTRGEAVNLQRSARGKGLPGDLYVQNYSR